MRDRQVDWELLVQPQQSILLFDLSPLVLLTFWLGVWLREFASGMFFEVDVGTLNFEAPFSNRGRTHVKDGNIF